MSPRLRAVGGFGLALAALFAIGTATAACNTILGLGDYVVGHPADAGVPFDAQVGDEADASMGSTPDATAPSDGSSASDAPNCDADPRTFTDPSQCYACAPTTSPQFANACTNSMCVPFDDTRLTNLPADGGLPPVPPKDAASE